MKYRELGRTGWKISSIGFGAWAIGSLWGQVDEHESVAALNRAVDLGVNFFDTADVYGSEPLLGALRRQRREPIYIATKLGMQVNPNARAYTRANITRFVEDSLRNLDVEAIDLMQLHCPSIQVYNAEVFSILDDLVHQGKIRFYGVCVERIAEALQVLKFPNVQSVMIVFNLFRQRPIEDLFDEARTRRVGIIARVPLASGLLTGKMNPKTTFASDDHRSFNRAGTAFDKGETFSGVDFNAGLEAVDHLRPIVPQGWTMTQLALRWILMFDEVTCAIPGGKRPAQVEDNVGTADLPTLDEPTMARIRSVYDHYIRPQVHSKW